MKIGEKIKFLRAYRNISVDQFIEKTGLSKNYIWRLQNDIEVNPTLNVVQKIAEALGTTPAYLVDPDINAGPHDILDVEFLKSYLGSNESVRSRLQELLTQLRED